MPKGINNSHYERLAKVAQEAGSREIQVNNDESDNFGKDTVTVEDEKGNVLAEYDVTTFDTVPIKEDLDYIKEQHPDSQYWCMGRQCIPSEKTRSGWEFRP